MSLGLWEGKDCGIAGTPIYVSLGIYTLKSFLGLKRCHTDIVYVPFYVT